MIDIEHASARERVKTAREELRRAEEDTKRFDKARRDEERKTERRAAIVGRVAMVLGGNDGEFWTMIWPHVVTQLGDASNEDRALFQLPPRAVDQAHGSIDVSNSATDTKKE